MVDVSARARHILRSWRKHGLFFHLPYFLVLDSHSSPFTSDSAKTESITKIEPQQHREIDTDTVMPEWTTP